MRASTRAFDGAIRHLMKSSAWRAHDGLDLFEPPVLRRRHADVAHFARGFHCKQRRQVLLPREKIVDCDQVEAGDIPPLPRFRDLRAPARTGGDPNLVGGEDTRRPAQLREPVADHFLRRAVHRRGIDHPSPGVEEIPASRPRTRRGRRDRCRR
jgi:hypothetical protein